MVQGGILQRRARGTTGPIRRRATPRPATCCPATGTNNANFYTATWQRRLHRPDELPDAGGGVCGVPGPLRHVRHGRRCLPVERGSRIEQLRIVVCVAALGTGTSSHPGLLLPAHRPDPSGRSTQTASAWQVSLAGMTPATPTATARVDINDLTIVLTNSTRPG